MIATSWWRREEERGSDCSCFIRGAPQVPSCLVSTGHLSKCCDATAVSRPHHVARLRSNHCVARTSLRFYYPTTPAGGESSQHAVCYREIPQMLRICTRKHQTVGVLFMYFVLKPKKTFFNEAFIAKLLKDRFANSRTQRFITDLHAALLKNKEEALNIALLICSYIQIFPKTHNKVSLAILLWSKTFGKHWGFTGGRETLVLREKVNMSVIKHKAIKMRESQICTDGSKTDKKLLHRESAVDIQ